MDRVVISRRVLDRLIRAKLEQLDECLGVNALPVVTRSRPGRGCNWLVPGWTGEAANVNRCSERMQNYLDFLRGQFDISG
jgi:hypothetical protein